MHHYRDNHKLPIRSLPFLFALLLIALLNGCGVAELREETSDGGLILLELGDPANEYRVLATANASCARRGLGSATISGPTPTVLSFGNTFYSFTCSRRTFAPIAIPQPPIPSKGIDIGLAKEKCRDLGFKAGTEAFGTCILKLSK